jgi:hypothetical protein
MTDEVVWGYVCCRRGVGVGTLHTGGRCEAVVLFLFLAVTFLSFYVEGVSRFCLRSGLKCTHTLSTGRMA